jgi:hypothetical protein
MTLGSFLLIKEDRVNLGTITKYTEFTCFKTKQKAKRETYNPCQSKTATGGAGAYQ